MPRGWSPCSRCPDIAPPGRSACDMCRAEADRARRPAGNPYSTKGHRRFREDVLARDPRCVCTGECGAHVGLCAAVSTVADHYPVERVDLLAMSQDPDDPDRGRGVCAPCHDRKTARTKPAGWAAR